MKDISHNESVIYKIIISLAINKIFSYSCSYTKLLERVVAKHNNDYWLYNAKQILYTRIGFSIEL